MPLSRQYNTYNTIHSVWENYSSFQCLDISNGWYRIRTLKQSEHEMTPTSHTCQRDY